MHLNSRRGCPFASNEKRWQTYFSNNFFIVKYFIRIWKRVKQCEKYYDFILNYVEKKNLNNIFMLVQFILLYVLIFLNKNWNSKKDGQSNDYLTSILAQPSYICIQFYGFITIKLMYIWVYIYSFIWVVFIEAMCIYLAMSLHIVFELYIYLFGSFYFWLAQITLYKICVWLNIMPCARQKSYLKYIIMSFVKLKTYTL